MFDICENESLGKVAMDRFCPLSGLFPNFCKNALRCDIGCDIGDVCLSGFFCLDPVWCLDYAQIFDKDETELSGLSLSLSADVWYTVYWAKRFCEFIRWYLQKMKPYLSDSFLFFGLVNVF